MKCDNCTNPATYLISSPAVSDVKYCVRDLPAHLRMQAANGDFDIAEPVQQVPADVIKPSKKKAVEEPVVEEVVVEEPAADPAE
jgi:hypothetical protein